MPIHSSTSSLLAGSFAIILLAGAGAASAQLVNYGEAMGTYKDQRTSGVRVVDSVTPGVTARSAVAFALAKNKIVDQSALLQPDGTLKLPEDQNNLVIRTSLTNVSLGSDGQLRIASPTIQGDVRGNVTLYVEGRGVQNITVVNSGNR